MQAVADDPESVVPATNQFRHVRPAVGLHDPRAIGEMDLGRRMRAGVVRMGINTLDYRLVDSADATAWLSRRWGQSSARPPRLDAQFQGNIVQS